MSNLDLPRNRSRIPACAGWRPPGELTTIQCVWVMDLSGAEGSEHVR
jgi:hypothetical protein